MSRAGTTFQLGLLTDCTLAIDTRLRDVLRGVRSGDGEFDLPACCEHGLVFERPAVEDAIYAAEASVLVVIDGIVRAESRRELREVLAELEHGPARRIAGVGSGPA